MSLPDNAAAIFQGLLGGGLTPVAASGVLGNIEAESGGNLDSVGDGGGGLLGYTPISSAPAGGAPGSSLSDQISAVLAYITNSYPGGVSQLDSFTTPTAAGESFAQYGERCAACGYQDGTSQLAVRGSNAQEVYNAYQTGSLGSGTTNPATGSTTDYPGGSLDPLNWPQDVGQSIGTAVTSGEDFAVKMALVTVGLGLAVLGIWKLANPGKSATESVSSAADKAKKSAGEAGELGAVAAA